MNISSTASKEIRSFALRKGTGCSTAPIIVKEGKFPPRWKGESFYYINKSGDLIRHPNAYRKAWGKPIYVPSSRHIIVGKDWLKQLEIDLIQVKLMHKRNKFVSRELAFPRS